MKRELLDMIRCPECAAFPLACEAFDEDPSDGLVHGVLWCRSCGAWYPVEDRLLELLQPSLAYRADRARFWGRYETRLVALGLAPLAVADAPEDVAAQRHQQEHFDWYGDNDRQTYATYERMRFWQIVDREIFATWCAGMQPGSRLLDVGCAQGRSTFKVNAPGLTVVGFDISKRLVAQAIQRARGRASMHFFVADATRMPVLDRSFDYVLIYGVLHHLPSPPRICREVSRVLREGGTFFCSENNESVFHPIFEWLQQVNPIWYEEAGEHSHIHSSELQAWLTEAGFESSIRSNVFVPPHLLNVLPVRLGRDLLTVTDGLFIRTPWLRDQGGLLVSTSVKRVGSDAHSAVNGTGRATTDGAVLASGSGRHNRHRHG